ncbi:S-adenosyl-L-methionine-dependent methyltransferase [Sistotremastrum niveocremeum HHB9708]|uniref:Large ribosomal subunit protein eL42 n=1 Tax=Sistotremastrum niveocremeum HHB9708 TaxID=1314777 RepID=A0A164YLT6_9AGAM|nr:S-adenosyl-L-methionine-dependent methyltransferase [Sistotremastrum niveocremeum HHB9708]
MVNIPKTRRTYCKGKTCKKHTPHKVTQYKKGKDSTVAQGKRRYDRKQSGYGGQTKPVFHKKAKTTKKVVLRLECTVCKYKMQMALKRCKHFELGGDKKTKGAALTFKKGGRVRTETVAYDVDGKGDKQGYSTDIDMNNAKFERYYKTQDIVPEDEWDTLMQSLRAPLPTTFRMAGSRSIAHTLNTIIKDSLIPGLEGVEFDGEIAQKPEQIPWYPEGLAWQFNVSKRVLRKSPEFKKFHNFLVYETEVGNISRQEAVSMIPPLFLDVQPDDIVADMCAAPGSKTAQLLESLHISSAHPRGLLVSNDSDSKRCHLLIHQSARLPSPSLIVTNLDASSFPNIQIERGLTPHIKPIGPGRPAGELATLQFSKILCDVPCSGDGTLRKNLGIWKSWNTGNANGLHGLQLRILERAMRMLAPGGRIVYSTCSLNPVENEAVIASALNSTRGFELVDVSTQLPSLKRRAGLSTWYPQASSFSDSSDLQAETSYSEWKAKNTSRNKRDILLPSMFAPDNASSLNLERCMRFLPHLQDTGGFFVAVLQHSNERLVQLQALQSGIFSETADQAVMDVDDKSAAEISSQATPAKRPSELAEDQEAPHKRPRLDLESEETATETHLSKVEDLSQNNADDVTEETAREGVTVPGFKEPPFTFLPSTHPQVTATIARLKLSPEFPSSNLFMHAPMVEDDSVQTKSARTMYLANDIVKSFLTKNDYVRLRIVSAGAKILARQEGSILTKGQFRILDDGMDAILPYIDPSSIIAGTISDLRVLMEQYNPQFSAFEGSSRTVIEDCELGNQLVRFQSDNPSDHHLHHPLILPLWKGETSITLMVDKKSKSALSLRLFGEDITFAGRRNLKQDSIPEELPQVTES